MNKLILKLFHFYQGLPAKINTKQNYNFDWQSSYPHWWWWHSSHHNNHNHNSDHVLLFPNDVPLRHTCVDNVKTYHQTVNDPKIKSCDLNGSTKTSGNGYKLDQYSSCFYCWRGLTEGAKKPTYKELFAFEVNRQQHSRLKRSPRPHSVHTYPANPNVINGMRRLHF